MGSMVYSFVFKHWKWLAGGLVVIGAVWSFNVWKDNLIDQADAAGFERARAAYQHAVEEANEREQATQAKLDVMTVAFGALGSQREQQINLTLKPLIESIEHEVATDPRYRSCAVSDGVLDDLNAGRAAVDASVDASNPR